MVHGIGTYLDIQIKNEKDFQTGLNKVIKGGYFESKYKIVTHIVDWKTTIENSFIRERMEKIHTPSHVANVREVFDQTVPDALAYLNPRFRSNILETVVEQCNHIFVMLSRKNPNFKGKVSIIGHSLGSVISYDMLKRQNYSNFQQDGTVDISLEACVKAQSDEALRMDELR